MSEMEEIEKNEKERLRTKIAKAYAELEQLTENLLDDAQAYVESAENEEMNVKKLQQILEAIEQAEDMQPQALNM